MVNILLCIIVLNFYPNQAPCSLPETIIFTILNLVNWFLGRIFYKHPNLFPLLLNYIPFEMYRHFLNNLGFHSHLIFSVLYGWNSREVKNIKCLYRQRVNRKANLNVRFRSWDPIFLCHIVKTGITQEYSIKSFWFLSKLEVSKP